MRSTVQAPGRRHSWPSPPREVPLRDPVATIVDGQWRVVLEREIADFAHMGEARQKSTTRFLDGEEVVKVSGATPTRKRVEALPVRTQTIADFGRLQQGAAAVLVLMNEYGPDEELSPEDAESLLRAHRNLKAWRAAVQERVDQADETIALVNQRLNQLVQ